MLTLAAAITVVGRIFQVEMTTGMEGGAMDIQAGYRGLMVGEDVDVGADAGAAGEAMKDTRTDTIVLLGGIQETRVEMIVLGVNSLVRKLRILQEEKLFRVTGEVAAEPAAGAVAGVAQMVTTMMEPTVAGDPLLRVVGLGEAMG